MKTRHAQLTPYITRDGTEIREMMHPAVHGELGARHQSLAEARLPAEACRTATPAARKSITSAPATAG